MPIVTITACPQCADVTVWRQRWRGEARYQHMQGADCTFGFALLRRIYLPDDPDTEPVPERLPIRDVRDWSGFDSYQEAAYHAQRTRVRHDSEAQADGREYPVRARVEGMPANGLRRPDRLRYPVRRARPHAPHTPARTYILGTM